MMHQGHIILMRRDNSRWHFSLTILLSCVYHTSFPSLVWSEVLSGTRIYPLTNTLIRRTFSQSRQGRKKVRNLVDHGTIFRADAEKAENYFLIRVSIFYLIFRDVGGRWWQAEHIWYIPIIVYRGEIPTWVAIDRETGALSMASFTRSPPPLSMGGCYVLPIF